MITHCSFLLLVVGLMAFASPALARQDSYLPKDDIPGEELYNELAGEVHKLHNQELKLLQFLGGMTAKQQQDEELIQQELHKQQQPESDTLLDDLPAENPVKTLGRLARLQELPKPLTYQKPREEKKSNHYMSLCHFKLCNMGRKRNTRYLSFWN
ncbi:uncharacterized protein CNMa [Ochlerotatus camptorhynchus]|uniref:uncharacterized protein CNMa n=1 Tax=Ochlerotatus camptorhynchus TaxID=644619 RepID=UPI0031CE4BA5